MEPGASSSSARSIVLVTGSGRSGTSSLAGSLKLLGLHIPQPEVGPSPTNPRGHFEPRWVIKFHRSRLREARVHNIDSRPWAVDDIAAAVAGETGIGAELTDWLRTQLHDPGLPRGVNLVVKDPHALWFIELWRSACLEVGVDLRLVTALRHPAQVVGSRDLAYRQGRPDEVRRVAETTNVAGWLHAALITERAGRQGQRSFVRYDSLLEDWRTTLGRVDKQLDLSLTAQTLTAPHPLDDFLDAGLQRSALTWDDVAIPAGLRDLAEDAWQQLTRLVAEPHQPDAMGHLDRIHDSYRQMYLDAVDLVSEHTDAKVDTWRRRVSKLRAQRDAARTAEPGPAPATGDSRPQRLLRKLWGS